MPECPSVVGIDRNLGQIATCNGEIFHQPDLERLERNRKKYQKMMARRKKGSRKRDVKPSNRYLAARLKYEKASKKVADVRRNWCHQTSRQIADRYDVVVLEKLNTKGMTKATEGEGRAAKAELNRGILNSGWSRLEQMLKYKTADVIEIDSAFTSQRCSECGHTEKANRTSQAQFKC